MSTSTAIQKRTRKSLAPVHASLSSNALIDGTVCHLCGYLGRTRAVSIEKNNYNFLRHLPPAPGALPITDETHSVQACHLCGLLLDKQRELNHTSDSFFFKGFFRSTGLSHTNVSLSTNSREKSADEQEQITDKEAPIETVHSLPKPPITVTRADEITAEQTRSLPPPLRKAISTATNLSIDLQISEDMSSLDSCIQSIRSHFLSDYTSTSKSNLYDSCHLCLSIKPRGTLYTIFKSEYDFLASTQVDVCTLCYYHLNDQRQRQVNIYRRARPQCCLCRCRLHFLDWEIKLLETELLPFLLNLSHLREQLYDNQRLAVACDQCFYSVLFQYLDQERKKIPRERRTYSWQCTYSEENERFYDKNDVFSTSS